MSIPSPTPTPLEAPTPPAPDAAPRFDAFISYRRTDIAFARQLDKALNAYRPPKTLNVPQRPLRVFRDEGDLTGAEYFAAIDAFLARSDRLIVICSPAATASDFVSDEIRRFVRHRGAQHIVPLLLAGVPNNEARPDQLHERAFPAALLESLALPLAVEYRGFDPRRDKLDRGRFEGSWYTLLANLYGRSRDEIEQRERVRRTRRRNLWLGLGSAVSASLAVLAAVAWWQKLEADDQRNVALRGLARYLVNVAEAQRSERPQNALLLAVEAVRTTRDVDGSVTPEAHDALRRALAAAGGEPLGARGGQVRSALFTPGGSHAATVDAAGRVQVHDLGAAASPAWTLPAAAGLTLQALSADGRWLALADTRAAELALQAVGPPGAAPVHLGARSGPGERVLGFSSDSRLLATADAAARVRLWSLADPAAAPRVLAGHQPRRSSDGTPLGVVQAVVGPASGWLFTSAWDRVGLMWNLADPQAPPQPLPDADAHASGHFSADGRWFAQRTDDAFGQRPARVALWQLAGTQWQPVALPDRAPPPEAPASAKPPAPVVIGFVEAPLRLLTQQADEVRVWDLQAPPAQARRIAGRLGTVSRDARWLVVAESGAGDRGATLHLHDLRDAQAESRELLRLDAPPRLLRLNGSGTHLAVLSAAGRPLLVDLRTPEPQPFTLRGQDTAADALHFSADDRALLATAVWGDFSVRRWRVQNPSSDPVQLDTFSPPKLDYRTPSGGGGGEPGTGLPDALAIDRSGRWLALPGPKGEAWLVSLDDPAAAPRVFGGFARTVTATAFSADGTQLIAASWDHELRLWSLADPAQPPRVLKRPAGERASSVSALALSPDGQWVATGGAFGEVALWHTGAAQDAPRMLAGHRGWITALAFAADSRTLLSAGDDGTLRRWRVDAPADDPGVKLDAHSRAVLQMRALDGGRRVVTAGADALLRLWTPGDPAAPPLELRGHERDVVALATDATERWLASGGDDGQLRLWDLQAPERAPLKLGARQAPISAVALSADARWLAAGERGGGLRLWDRQDPQAEPLRLVVPDAGERDRAAVWGLRFSPDGRWLIGMVHGSAHFWRLRLDEQLALACRIAGRNLGAEPWRTHLERVPYRLTCPALGLHPRWVEEADALAKRTDTARAAAMYAAAVRVDPALAIDPPVRARTLAVDALLASARSSVRSGDADAALAMLADANRLDPALKLDPAADIARIRRADALLREATAKATAGALAPAIALFRQALEADPELRIDPERDARRLWAPALEQRGDELARQGQRDAAMAEYEAALAHGIASSLDPTERYGSVRGDELVVEARRLGREGRLDDATRRFAEALALKPGLGFDHAREARKGVAEHRVERAERARGPARVPEAAALYREALELDPGVAISAHALNDLCWAGATGGFARDVLDLCELAASKAPGDLQILDSRGIARVLTGDTAGAIADLSAYADHALRDAAASPEGQARRRVVEQLRRGVPIRSFAQLQALGIQP